MINSSSESNNSKSFSSILFASVLALSVSVNSAIAQTQEDVSSCMVNQATVEEGISKYPSKIGACYIRFGDMAQNYSDGELEFLQSIKNEKGEDRLDLIELWTLSLEDLYSARDEVEIDGGLIEFFEEFTPNMVKSWKGMKGMYGLIAKGQQLDTKGQQLDRDLRMAKKLRGE